MSATLRPLTALLARRHAVVIDGAMSTALESLGADLNDPLWSAKELIDHPERIREGHRLYYAAGADIAITASYQASVEGFAVRGIDERRARQLIARSAELAREARAVVAAESPERADDLLVAGSIGPYGAYLADGSEYRGDYVRSADEYRAFHRPRIEALAGGGVDLYAVETQPKLDETLVILEEVVRVGKTAWVTFSLADGEHLADGTSLADAARAVGTTGCVEAVGMNCGPREIVATALDVLAESGLPLIVYPNSGETYDPTTKTWHSPTHGAGWDTFVPLWERKGARCIGGCCRTLPADIAQIAALMRGR